MRYIDIDHKLLEPEIKLYDNSTLKQKVNLSSDSKIEDSLSLVLSGSDDAFETMKIQRLAFSIISNLGSNKIKIVERE